MSKRNILILKRGTLFVSIGILLSGAVLSLAVLITPVAAQDSSTEASNPCEALRTIPAASDMSGSTSMGMEEEGPMVPSNPGGPGPALDLQGDPEAGAQVLADNCQKCHGENGQGGVDNPGADEATIPSLNPLDADMFDPDPKVYACILDLFVEHGSVPPGNPQETMPAWGDEEKLTPQQIADVLAYVISLNPLPETGAETTSTEATNPCEALRTIPAATDTGESMSMGMEEGPMVPSNPGGPGPALDLQGDPEAGAQVLADNCQKCHGENGQGGVENPGADEATIPSLNPLDADMFDPDPKVYACILDLFVEHGSVPPGNPQETMPAWGDEEKLTPQQIADVLAYVISLNPLPETEEIARPSNPGEAGPAVDLTGDAEAGAQVFVDNCQKCHGEQGQGGIDNPGSDDGTVPPLNPIDETLISSDPHIYATNLDLFIEHGSTPAGTNPKETMPAWGDEGKLTPQQIADVIAYVISLNEP